MPSECRRLAQEPLQGFLVLQQARRLQRTPPISEKSPIQAAVFRIAPGGRIGPSTATVPQIFAVLQGEGEVTGEDGVSTRVVTGDAVLLTPGEDHEATSASGVTLLIIEGDGLDRFRQPTSPVE